MAECARVRRGWDRRGSRGLIQDHAAGGGEGMHRRSRRFVAGVLPAVALVAGAPAGASDRVAKALLDTLRANGTIDAKQYEDLNRVIEDESAAEEANPTPAVAAPPPEAAKH